MDDDEVSSVIRRAIGGDPGARAWIGASADTIGSPALMVMASLLDHRAERLSRAERAATTSRDRQLVAIARAHLHGASELVDALARDHLVDHPDSYLVAWIASDSARSGGNGQAVASTEVDPTTRRRDGAGPP